MVDGVIEKEIVEKDIIKEFFELVQKLHQKTENFRNNHIRIIQQIDQEKYDPVKVQLEQQLSSIEKIRDTINGVMTIIGILLKVEKYEMDRLRKKGEDVSSYKESFYELINMQRDFMKLVDDLNRLKRNYEIQLKTIQKTKLFSIDIIKRLISDENPLIDENQRIIENIEKQMPLLSEHISNLLHEHAHVLSENNKEINEVINDVKKIRISLSQSLYDYLESNVDYFNNRLGKTNLLIIFYLLSFIKRYDPNVTYWHVLRVGMYTYHIAARTGFKPEIIYAITIGAMLHDLGKIMVPAEIVSSTKPRITEDEFKILKSHPIDGYKFLRIQYPIIAEYVGAHHCYKKEGSYGIETKQKEAILIAIADVFDALVEKRSYKESFPPEKVRSIMYKEFSDYKYYVDFLINEFQLKEVA